VAHFNLKVENPRNARDDNPCLISVTYVTVNNIAPIDNTYGGDELAIPGCKYNNKIQVKIFYQPWENCILILEAIMLVILLNIPVAIGPCNL
jgi:hypothetical protein